MKTTMTIEKAAELVSKSAAPEKYELFSHFEELLNPHPVKINEEWNVRAVDWQKMFAELCGFSVAKNVVVVKEEK